MNGLVTIQFHFFTDLKGFTIKIPPILGDAKVEIFSDRANKAINILTGANVNGEWPCKALKRSS